MEPTTQRPETRALERYYIDRIRRYGILDVPALALDEQSNNLQVHGNLNQEQPEATKEAELALNVLRDGTMKPSISRAIFGPPLLRATMNKIMAQDPNFPKDWMPLYIDQMRNYKRRDEFGGRRSKVLPTRPLESN